VSFQFSLRFDSNLFGYQILIKNMGWKKKFGYILVACCIISFILLFVGVFLTYHAEDELTYNIGMIIIIVALAILSIGSVWAFLTRPKKSV